MAFGNVLADNAGWDLSAWEHIDWEQFEVRVADFQCYTCHGNSYAECAARQELVTCPKMNDESENTWSCGISEKKYYGTINEIRMGCMQTKAWFSYIIYQQYNIYRSEVSNGRSYPCPGLCTDIHFIVDHMI